MEGKTFVSRYVEVGPETNENDSSPTFFQKLQSYKTIQLDTKCIRKETLIKLKDDGKMSTLKKLKQQNHIPTQFDT